MPASYALCDSYIVVALTGVVSGRQILEAQRKLFDDPKFIGELPRLIDASHVIVLDVSETVVRHVSQAAYERGMRRAALVSSNSVLVYGLMRMYAQYAGDAKVEVFRDRKLAIAWLRETVQYAEA